MSALPSSAAKLSAPPPRRLFGRDPWWIFLLKVLAHVLLIAGALVMIFPFVWALSSSFKNTGEIFDYPPRLIPQIFRYENYIKLFTVDPNFGDVSFAQWFGNSVFISLARVVLVLFFASLAGFAFAKYEFRFRQTLFLIVLGTMMLPFQVQMIPLFVLMTKLHWSDSYLALVVPFAADAFGAFLMRQYMVNAIPRELLDAARMDGASEFRLYWQIVLPLASPALATLAIITFIGSWNSFLWPLIILRTGTKYTLPLGMANLLGVSGQGEELWGLVMAGSVLATLPLLIVFLAGQKQFVSGLTTGAVRE